jgi:hypothetical protein
LGSEPEDQNSGLLAFGAQEERWHNKKERDKTNNFFSLIVFDFSEKCDFLLLACFLFFCNFFIIILNR